MYLLGAKTPFKSVVGAGNVLKPVLSPLPACKLSTLQPFPSRLINNAETYGLPGRFLRSYNFHKQLDTLGLGYYLAEVVFSIPTLKAQSI